MMTVDVPVGLRQIIDARLDNIERALMTQSVARGDRRQILSAIDDQILEMLSQSAVEEPTRDDVLSVLAKLDPPEAYLDLSSAEISRTPTMKAIENRMGTSTVRQDNSNNSPNVLAVISLVLICIATIGAFLWWILAWFGLIAVASLSIGAGVCGTIALCQFIKNRSQQRGLWMAVIATSCAPAVAFFTWVSYLLLELG